MKRLLLFATAFTLVACQTQTEPEISDKITSSDVSSTVLSVSSAKMQTYTSQKNGFTFHYPADWKVADASDAEAGFNIIAWVYTPKAAVAVDTCQRMHKKAEWRMECGSVQADSAIGVYRSDFIRYDSLSETDKQNYPGYKKLTMGDADVFAYSEATNALTQNFHINNPSGKSGVTVTVFAKDEQNLSVAQQILSTFTFTTNK